MALELPHRELLSRDTEEHVLLRAMAVGLPHRELSMVTFGQRNLPPEGLAIKANLRPEDWSIRSHREGLTRAWSGGASVLALSLFVPQPLLHGLHQELNPDVRASTSQKCEVVPRRARVQGS